MSGRFSSQFAILILPIAPVVVLLAWGLNARTTSPLAWKAQQLVTAGQFDHELAHSIELAAQPFTHGSRYQGRLVTSSVAPTGSLGIYAVDTTSSELSTLTCNCAFVGSGTIVCDANFVRNFINSTKLGLADPAGTGMSKRIDAVYQKWLLSWLVGHEIGHAILHDEAYNWTLLLHDLPTPEAKELQADRYFAEHVPGMQRQQASFVLTDFAFQAFSLTYQPIAKTDGYASIAPSLDGIHPPWLIRALSVARTISEQQSGNAAKDDFYGSLLSKVHVEAGGKDIGNLCTALNLRAAAWRATQSRQPATGASATMASIGTAASPLGK